MASQRVTSQSPQGHSFAANAAFNVLYKVLNVIFPLISSVYLARVLLPAGVGAVSYAQNVASYLVLVACLGIPMYGVREIAKRRDSQRDTDTCFSEIIAINFCSTTVALLAYAIVVALFFTSDLPLYLVCGLPILFNYISIDWFYQGREDYVYIAVRSIIVKGLSVLAILLFVHGPQDYVLSAFLTVMGTCGNYLFNIVRARRYVHLTLHGLHLRQRLRPIFVLVACSAGAQLYNYVDVLMLGAMDTPEVVGWYSNAMKAIMVVFTLCTAISEVFLPRISYLFETDREKVSDLVTLGMQIVFYFAAPIVMGTVAVAHNLVIVMFGEPFAPAAFTMQLLAPIMIFKGLGDIVSYQVIIGARQEGKLVGPYFCATALNVALNLFLIPLWSLNGAAVASVLTECFVNMLLLRHSLRLVRPRVDVRFVAGTVLSALVMWAAVMAVGTLVHNVFLGLVLDVVVAVAIYAICGVLGRNPILQMIFGILKRRLSLS